MKRRVPLVAVAATAAALLTAPLVANAINVTYSAAGAVTFGGRTNWCLSINKLGENNPVFAAPCGANGFYQNWVAIRGENGLGDISPIADVNLCIGVPTRGNTVVLVKCSEARAVGFRQIGSHNAWEITYPSSVLLSAPLKLTRPRVLSWQHANPKKWVQVLAFPEWRAVQTDVTR